MNSFGSRVPISFCVATALISVMFMSVDVRLFFFTMGLQFLMLKYLSTTFACFLVLFFITFVVLALSKLLLSQLKKSEGSHA